MGGGVVAHTQKWGDPFAAEGRAILHTPPPQYVFGTFPKLYKISVAHTLFNYYSDNTLENNEIPGFQDF